MFDLNIVICISHYILIMCMLCAVCCVRVASGVWCVVCSVRCVVSVSVVITGVRDGKLKHLGSKFLLEVVSR